MSLIIIFMLISTCIFSSISRADPDDQFIAKVCAVTNDPTACESCVDYVARSTNITTDADVAKATLHCANGAMDDLILVTNDIAERADNNFIRIAFHGCLIYFRNARTNGDEIRHKIENGLFAEAANLFNEDIFKKFDLCTEFLKQEGVDLPPTLAHGIDLVKNDYNITSQVLLTTPLE